MLKAPDSGAFSLQKLMVPKKGLELEPLCWREPAGEILSGAKDLSCSEVELESMVPKKGLEPPHPCGYMDLNHARLPIPPLRRGKLPSRNHARCAGNYLILQ